MSLHEIEKQFKVYKEALILALSVEKDARFIKEYNDHLKLLNEIQLSFSANDFQLVLSQLKSEERYYGWSFLPDEHGSKVESAFYKLHNLIKEFVTTRI